MGDERGADFFISYTTADRDWAEWIAWQLEHAGYAVLLQAWDFVPGKDFIHEMEKATSGSRRTIALLSGNYRNSSFGEAEWRSVFAKDPTGEKGLLIPVKVAPCSPPALLQSRVYIDLTGKAADEARDALLTGLSGKGARPSANRFSLVSLRCLQCSRATSASGMKPCGHRGVRGFSSRAAGPPFTSRRT